MAWLTGICRNPGEVSALPGGEVSLPPLEGTSEGVVVWERVASDLGALEAPVTITVRDGRAVAIEGGPSAARLRAIVDDGRATPTTSARSGSGSTRRRGSATRSPRPRRRSARCTSRSAIRPTSTAAWSNATSTSMAWSCRRRSSSTASPVVVDGRHVYELPRDATVSRRRRPTQGRGRRSRCRIPVRGRRGSSSGCARSRARGRGPARTIRRSSSRRRPARR